MNAGLPEKRSITPEKAIVLLNKNGVKVTEKEAEEILEFLYILARLTVNQYIKDADINHI